jgi:hypothetical protein
MILQPGIGVAERFVPAGRIIGQSQKLFSGIGKTLLEDLLQTGFLCDLIQDKCRPY